MGKDQRAYFIWEKGNAHFWCNNWQLPFELMSWQRTLYFGRLLRLQIQLQLRSEVVIAHRSALCWKVSLAVCHNALYHSATVPQFCARLQMMPYFCMYKELLSDNNKGSEYFVRREGGVANIHLIWCWLHNSMSTGRRVHRRIWWGRSSVSQTPCFRFNLFERARKIIFAP